VRAAEAMALEEHLAALIGKEFELRERRLDSGDLAVVLVVPPRAVAAVEQALSAAGVVELPCQKGYAGEPLSRAIPAMRDRIAAIDRELSAIVHQRAQLTRKWALAQARQRGARSAPLEAIGRGN
jgi:hypothetical protein